MRTAIVYHSAGGNTRALAEKISCYLPKASLFHVSEFNVHSLSEYDGLIVGVYTWGDGDLPAKMIPFYEELEAQDLSHLTTAVFGTGETNYQHFCRGVDYFRDMLYARSNLSVTLKVEQMYQDADLIRIEKFTKIFTQAIFKNLKKELIIS